MRYKHMGRSALITSRKVFAYTLFMAMLLACVLLNAAPAHAAAGINPQINFQGRLLNAQGATVPDGYYNIQFKIYQDGDGLTAGNTTGSPAGTLEWTENWMNANGQGILVRNGFLSVQLGVVNPFASQVDWNQDTLWLSMNVGNTNASCTPFASCGGDGEMVPMKRMSANAYAMSAGSLNGISAAGFIQNTTAPQTANFNVTGAGTVGGLFTAGGGASVSGAAISMNANSNFAVNIATGTSTGAVAIGGGSNTFSLSSTGLDISTAGAISNATTITATGAITGVGVSAGVGSLSGTGGATVSGATVSLNANSNNGTDINTGTSTGLVSIGGGSGTFALNTTNIDISAAGAISNATTIGATGNITSGATVQGATINATTKFQLNGTDGSTASCSGGQVLQNATVAGGIITAGSCAAMSGGVTTVGTILTSGKSADGAVITSTTIQMQEADATYAGLVTTNAQTFAGAKTFNALVTGGAGLTVSGAAISLNASSNFAVNIGTGTSTGEVTIGGGAGTFVLDTTTIDITNAGALTTTSTITGAIINATTKYQINGTDGTAATCAGGQFLQNAVIAGGILTGGTCAGTSGDGGVTTVGTIDSQTKSADGGVIIGSSLFLQTADVTSVGLVSIAAQTFNGDKTFDDNVVVTGTINTNTFTGSVLTFGAAAGATINSAASQTLTMNGASGLAIQTGGTTRATFDGTNTMYLGNGASNAAPANFTVSGTASTTSGVAGGALTIQGGNATVGNANGGNLNLTGGTGIGTGAKGLVVLSTPTFQATTNDPNCYTSGALVASNCTIATASINSSSTILVGFNQSGRTATLPDPTITTAGRVVYISAANGSIDFTLSANGGGTGNVVAMRQNTSATMIWNGSDWTAAGASSSTTLQSAYDNTLQSAGGAELVVSKTSATNGLTIRDSLTNPVDGTLFSVQTSSAANLFSVNSNVTEYASNAGAEAAGLTTAQFPSNTWLALSSTVSRYTTAGSFIANGQASVSVVTSASANTGVKNVLNTALTANTLYNVSFAARVSSGTFTDMNVYYSADGTAASVVCTTGQAVTNSVQTKVNCAFKAPASGISANNAILIRQTSGVARTFYVDNLSVTLAADFNYATDGGVDDNTNFATNWPSVSSTVTRSTTIGNDASSSAQVVTTAGAGQGVRNKLSINPLQNTTYRVTVYASSTASGFDDFNIRYSRDGGTNFIDCADYNTQSISDTAIVFTKVTCYITTDASSTTNPYVYFTQGDATARTFYIDTFSMTLSTKITPNVQIGGGANGGPVTLLTMDRAAAAPIASNNELLLGSMYYDTSLGKLQCYEADGWGACGSSPDDIVTISPEYTNAVLHGTGVGTMTSDLCSDTLNINDGSSGQATICGSNETFNFYKWTSPQATAQTYSIFVTYQLPNTFKSFLSGQASLMGRTDSTNSTVSYQIYRQTAGSALFSCGSPVSVSTGVASAWQTGIASGAADPSTCGFTPGSSIVFKIDVIASSNANAYVGNLNFAFNNN